MVHTALEGDVLLGDGSLVAYYNNRWMDNVRHCRPDATEEALRDRPVVCSGFSVGSAGVAPSSTHQGAIVTERLFCTPGYAPIHSANLKRPPECATPPPLRPEAMLAYWKAMEQELSNCHGEVGKRW